MVARALIYIILLFSITTGFSQTGKEFWFAVPYVDETHDSDTDNFFRISTGEASAVVEFYCFQDASGNALAETLTHSVEIPANSVSDVTLSIDGTGDLSLPLYTNSSYEIVLNKGIHITSSNPVTIYYEVGSYNNSDIFSLKGKDALGTDFYPVFQNYMKNHLGGTWGLHSWETVDIIATEDNTVIDYFIPSNFTETAFTNGEKVSFDTYTQTTITLNKGQTYSIKAPVRTAKKAFDGIYISSSKDIAVTIKDDSAVDNRIAFSADLIGDQIVPISVAGSKYIIPDFDGFPNDTPNPEDMIQIAVFRAIEDNTSLLIGGETITLDKGDVYSDYNFNHNNTFRVAEADKNILCFHVAGYPSAVTSATEVGGAVLPAVDECSGSTQASFVIPTAQNGYEISLISRTGTANTFYYKTSSGNWTAFNPTFTGIDVTGDGNDDWYCSIDLNFTPTPGESYLIKNTEASFHLGVLSGVVGAGNAHGGFYSYFSDFTAPDIQISFSKMPNGQVQLFAFGGVKDSYTWERIYHTFASTADSSICYQSYFSDDLHPAVCSDDINPILLSERMLYNDKEYFFKATGKSICSDEYISSNVDIEVVANIAYLPVSLSEFNVKATEKGEIKLMWETLSEKDNDFFTIEHSSDGIYFSPVGYLNGAGTTSKKNNYSFTDNQSQAGIHYYRLKQTDYNGTFSYSKTISVVTTNSNNCSVYPNVITNNESPTVIIPVSPNNTTVHVFSSEGKLTYSTETEAGATQLELPTNLGNGLYNIFIKNLSFTEHHRLLVANK